ncbi:hypothetical protein K438DRAFT_1735653 [Mycena galopus ATCC 62051]|nr:hypothetical protein K438DRAFT_1735653 [Mycena galopus ATCC 62051]
MSSHYEILPPSFLVDDIIRVGSHPVSGGGYADICLGRKDDQQLCLKVLRIFSRDLDRLKVVDSLFPALRLGSQLRHPNILPFFGVNVEKFSPSFCLISPWMANGNILDFMGKTW